MNPTEQQLATAAIQFLGRCDLKGSETPAFTRVIAWLETLQQPPAPEKPAAKSKEGAADA